MADTPDIRRFLDPAKVRREAHPPALVDATKNFTVEETLKVYAAGTPDEKRLLRPVINRKIAALAQRDPRQAREMRVKFRALQGGRVLGGPWAAQEARH